MAFVNKKRLSDLVRLFFLNIFVKTNEQSPINNKFLTHFVSYYTSWGHAVNQKKNDLGFGLLHYALVRIIKPKKILSIGSGRGFVPAILSLACRDNGFGKVYFVDAGFEEEDVDGNWQGVGFWKNINPKKYFKYLNADKHLNIYIQTTEEYIKNKSDKYEYIYIDGNHTYEGVKKDFNLTFKYLLKNGLMLFHDVNMKKTGKNYWVNVFIKNKKFKNKIDLMFDSGLTIIQK